MKFVFTMSQNIVLWYCTILKILLICYTIFFFFFLWDTFYIFKFVQCLWPTFSNKSAVLKKICMVDNTSCPFASLTHPVSVVNARWGDTEDASLTRTWKLSLDSARRSRWAPMWVVHSFMLSNHDFCRPVLGVPWMVPWRMVFAKVSWRVTWPYQVSLWCLMVARSGSSLPA